MEFQVLQAIRLQNLCKIEVILFTELITIEKKIFHNTKLINEVGELLIVIVLNMQNAFVVRPEVLSLTIFDEDDFLEKEKLIKFIETKTKEIIKNFINDQMMIDILKKNIKKKIKNDLGIKPLIELKIIRI